MQSGDDVGTSGNEKEKLRIWPRICVNASKHKEKSEKNKGKKRGRIRRIYHVREELIRQGKRAQEQKWLIQRQRIEEWSGSDLADLKALDKNESALEVQAILLGQLATEENYLKGLGGLPSTTHAPFEIRLKEVEEALRTLRYSWDAHSPGSTGSLRR